MGQHTKLALLVTAIFGFSLLSQGSCEREEKQLFQQSRESEELTPSPLASDNNGWRPVVSPLTSSGSRSPTYRYIGSSSGSGSGSSSANSFSDSYRDNNHNSNKQYGHSNVIDSQAQSSANSAHRENSNFESRPNLYSENRNKNNEHRPNAPNYDVENVNTRGKTNISKPHYGHNANEQSAVRLSSSKKHPVLNKLQLHMESAEKAKKREPSPAYSTRVENFVPTPASLLGSFSEFGHATVRSREPASAKRDYIKGKKKDYENEYNYQVTEAINEYSMHLVPPPVYPPRYTDLHKKPYPGYRYTKPDLLGDEQRHVYYVHPPPSRPSFFPPTHTPRPSNLFFGPPSIPNFAGLNTHQYSGAIAGGLFQGPESVKYAPRPDVHNSGGNQYGDHQSTHTEQSVVQVTPSVQPFHGGETLHPQESFSNNKHIEQSFVRPDTNPYKNLIRQEELVTGRPSQDVRPPEGASFTVGSSFLAGNKPENEIRSQHITSQQFHGKEGFSPLSTVSPISFEQAFETGRPNPTVLTNIPVDQGRITRPFFPEGSATSFQQIQNSGPFTQNLPNVNSHFHTDEAQGNNQETTPHFLPTKLSDAHFHGNDSPHRKHPTASPHINEVHHSSRPWSEPIPPPEIVPITDIEVNDKRNERPSAQAQTETIIPKRKEERRPSHRRPNNSHRRPQFNEEVQKKLVPSAEFNNQESKEPEITTRLPYVNEQEQFDQIAPTRGYRVKGSRQPEIITELPFLQDEEPLRKLPPRGYIPKSSRQPEIATEIPFSKEDGLETDNSPLRGTVPPEFQQNESTTIHPTQEEEGRTEDGIFQQPTERPTESSKQNIMRPRKPSRYRPNSQWDEERETRPQKSSEKPHKRPSFSRFSTPATDEERVRPSEVDNVQQKEVRQKQRRRRPQHTTEEPPTLPPLPDEPEDFQFNQVAYPSLNDLFDKIPISPLQEHSRQTTTPRPSRRKNPYISSRVKNEESTTISEGLEPVTHQPEVERSPLIQKESEYAVHEDVEENFEDSSSVTQRNPEPFSDEISTSTTESPLTTIKSSTTSRYKPRLRFGANSTRPRFSIKDYKDRINRLPQTSSSNSEEVTTQSTESEPTSRSRFSSKVRGSYQKQEENKNAQEDSGNVTEASHRLRYPSRTRSSYQQRQENNRIGQEETVNETTTPKPRSRFRPKFGSGTSRFRTTTTDASTQIEDNITTTEKTVSKSGASRIRMPTGKYYSRYRSTTEDSRDSLEGASTNIEVTSTSKPQVRTKGIFSAARRRFPTRPSYGLHNDASSTEQIDYEESSTTNIEEIIKNQNGSSTTPSESSSTFATTKHYDVDEIKSTLSDMFTESEETSKPVDNEIKTPATRTFLFMPTMPTTRNEDTTSDRDNDKSSIMKIENDKQDNVKKPETEDEKQTEEEISPSQRVADLTSAATSGGYFNVMSLVKRKPFQYTVATEEPILPLEAFFSGNPFAKKS